MDTSQLEAALRQYVDEFKNLQRNLGGNRLLRISELEEKVNRLQLETKQQAQTIEEQGRTIRSLSSSR